MADFDAGAVAQRVRTILFSVFATGVGLGAVACYSFIQPTTADCPQPHIGGVDRNPLDDRR